MHGFRQKRGGFHYDVPLHFQILPPPRMRPPRRQNRPHQLFTLHRTADPFSEKAQVARAKTAEFHRFVVEGADIVLHPHHLRTGFGVDPPQRADMFPPYRRQETGTVLRNASVMPDHALQTGQTLQIVPAPVGVTGGR